MYAAQALTDGRLSADDLPPYVFVDDGVNGPQQADRSGTNFVIADGFSAGQDIVLGLNEGTWGLWVEAGAGPEFIIGDYNGPCLINFYQDEPVVSPFVTDDFEDTYTISAFGTSAPVTRVSICLWEVVNYQQGIKTINADLRFDDNEQKWIASFQYTELPFDQGNDDALGIKEGSMSSPVGTYQDQVSATILTVS